MNMKQRCAEIMSEIESIQRQLGWVVETETHKERLKHPISEEDVRWYARDLAQLKDNLNRHGPAIRCRTCNDSGWVKSQAQSFGGIFGFQNNEPCSACDKGREIKRERDEKARKAKEEQEARQEQIRLAQAQEMKWRYDLYKVCVVDVIKGKDIDFDAISKLERESEYLYKRCMMAQNWYQDEQYHLNGTGDSSIPNLWEREARLAWVKETVPFGFKAHEDYYEIEGNLLLKIARTMNALNHHIFQNLPAYAKSDPFVEAYYKQLQELVAQVLSDTDTDANTQ